MRTTRGNIDQPEASAAAPARDDQPITELISRAAHVTRTTPSGGNPAYAEVKPEDDRPPAVKATKGRARLVVENGRVLASTPHTHKQLRARSHTDRGPHVTT
jgi:hypothetical protein